MSAILQSFEARLEPITMDWLDAVCAIENSAYTHPWTRANFTDSLSVGYHCQMLIAGDTLLGYFVAMKGVDEVHLLNITVAPAHQRQGWAPLMLEALAGWARSQAALWLWLEVRASNQRAIDIYTRNGFRRVGVRKGYYPALENRREDAVVMSLRLDETGTAWGALK
ncbi:ribosomal protein S18-alanine N-acetyltransferase [Variovorax sp. J22R133]|uniref:ribosomal protein S18-alanine N-acetyltransferase n=1 Tax=Variovorax brevis TaxID=3053503 RepID=UPI0025750BFB|nr:ribosomal protein S18-alanine N-acetyltransferase [Variovorax sp. J22R133]MDM0115372.1 ribosomal protein S18-alanine N-acetyltransferase [Variovorax sp. J22R133]